MDAQSLNCPNCGASVSSDDPKCRFCEALLATVSCPKCFALMFKGSKHCPQCGTAASHLDLTDLAPRKCPRCNIVMVGVEVGTTVVRECRTCFGLWVDLQSFEEICSDREQQSAVLGAARFEPEQGSISRADALRVRYVPCPECAQLMNRVNFAKCSGVVIDVCKGHGTWFDARELQQIVEFIHTGGLEASRQREKRTLEEEWRKLRLEQMSARTSGDQLVGGDITIGSHSSAVLAASELMKLFS